MNGICGWISQSSGSDEARTTLQAMSEHFCFFPGSDRTTHISPAASAAAVSDRSGQSGVFCDGRYLVSWEGTIDWSSNELAEMARQNGQGMAIARAYQQQGKEALQKIHGNFALAVIDLAEQTLLLAIDRMGIRPLYFCTAGEGIVFGSTATSVNQHPAIRRPIDPQAIYNDLYFHVVPSPRGIYQGHEKLQPAEYAFFSKGSLTKEFYWQPKYGENPSASEEELITEFKALLRTAVRSSTEGAGRTGAFLSGGTDSSTIAGILSELGTADTYSVRFDTEGYDESNYARITAQHFGTRHHEYTLTADDVVQAVPKMALVYDEPFGNASNVAAYYCARMAKKDGIDTLLGGDGGDELFAGNARYAKQKLFDYYERIPSGLRSTIIEPILFAPPSKYILPLRKLQSYVQQAKIPLPDRLDTYNFLHQTPSQEVFHPEFLASINLEEPLELNRTTFHQARAETNLNRMLYLELKITLADNDLRKVTRVCELAGVEARYPLLDERIFDLSTRVPTTLKLKGQKLRYFFKKALRDFLPPATLTRAKHGFGVPCGLWIKNHLGMRELAYDSLASLQERSILTRSYIDQLRQLHQTEHADYYGVMIWVLMTLEQWLQQSRSKMD